MYTPSNRINPCPELCVVINKKHFYIAFYNIYIMREKKRIIFWSTLFIVFILFTVIFAARTINRYELWKEHEEYLKSDNNTIEEWMHINLISKRSGIPNEVIYNEIGINESFTNNRKTLKNLCEDNGLNCTEAVAKLNRLVKSKS
jgi:hypothetical protein